MNKHTMMEQLKVLNALAGLQIETVNFQTGQITLLVFAASCENLSSEEMALAEAGKKVNAIKTHSERTGMSVKDSKKIVEDFLSVNNI